MTGKEKFTKVYFFALAFVSFLSMGWHYISSAGKSLELTWTIFLPLGLMVGVGKGSAIVRRIMLGCLFVAYIIGPTLMIVDIFNPALNFMTHDPSIYILGFTYRAKSFLVHSLSSLVIFIIMIIPIFTLKKSGG